MSGKLVYYCVRLNDHDVAALGELAAKRKTKPRTLARQVIERYLDKIRIESSSVNEEPPAAA